MSKRNFGKNCEVIWADKKRYFGLPISFTHYSIVENPGKWIKLFVEVGLFSTHIEEVQLFRIDDFSVYESITNKLLGVGNIDIYVRDSNQEQVNLVRIKNPYKVYDLITEYVEKDRKNRNVHLTEVQH